MQRQRQPVNQQSALPMGTTSQAALQASWEIDVFGANRAARDAAQARDSAHAGWHDARVSVAAEVANQYYGLRACEQLLAWPAGCLRAPTPPG
jgi:outer membrane protein TolC